MIQAHEVLIQKTAHYFTIGEPTDRVKQLWLCCHGYGQMARHFVKRFEVLENEQTLVIAPEGLSRFYTDGLAGKVGASWMTKEDRLTEIKDYCQYLKLLLDKYLPMLAPDVKITFLGFSQGCATVCRFADHFLPEFDRLILYGGFFPEDLDYAGNLDYWQTKDTLLVLGNADPYITPELKKKHLSFAAETGLKFKEMEFEGGHEIDREVIRRLV